jgi:hypothetical protein
MTFTETHVGFNDMTGGSPELNFRHNHSLMEYQMKGAFSGLKRVLEGDETGWLSIVESARRANKIFKTVLTATPALSYPAIRLPIKGDRNVRIYSYSNCKPHLTEYYCCVHLTFSTSQSLNLSTDYITITSTIIYSFQP